jgi:SAM-dependent methyltransferase
VSADDRELVSVGADKAVSGLPRHQSARERDRVREWDRRAPSTGARQPALWGHSEAIDGGNVFGQYPKGFTRWIAKVLRAQPDQILHVCSGALGAGHGVRVDIRPEAHPDVVADGRALPFAEGTFAAVAIDPPYTVEYARDLYGTEYPRPSALLREASRVVRPGGRIGLLHFFVAASPAGCEMERCYGVTTGVGYRIRAFTVYRRAQESML